MARAAAVPEPSLTLSRWLDAPVQRVFEAFTEPDQLMQWWGPRDFEIQELEFDAREGANYRVLTKGPEGQLFEHVGEFLRVEPPSRLTYSWRWVRGPLQREETLVQLEFVAERGGTRVHLVHSRFIDTAQRDAHVGWEQAFERLADWLVTR